MIAPPETCTDSQPAPFALYTMTILDDWAKFILMEIDAAARHDKARHNGQTWGFVRYAICVTWAPERLG